MSGGPATAPGKGGPEDHAGGSWLPGLHEGLLEEPQQRRSRRSALQILDAARTVLARDGVDGFTMAAVSEASGISIGGIYGRFDGKQGLMRAVGDMILTRLEDDLTERLERAGTTLADVVLAFVTCLSEDVASHAVHPLAEHSTDDEPLRARKLRARERMFASFRLAVLRHEDEIGHEDPEAALLTVFHMCLSSFLTAYDLGGGPGLPKSAAHLRDELARAGLAHLTSPAPRS
ncbi:TetR/AcrR family transcriptional regulator [Streptosporangium sp. NPDC001559]|uniref:TetR/AcrR family transcriptional regulator n=1 Tax=Streptosporangium sp. NPDC001559 TaxID=3366187 RepID=UPI0036E135BF